MQIKKITAAVCALALAAGAVGLPAVGEVFGLDTAVTASADLVSGDYNYKVLRNCKEIT